MNNGEVNYKNVKYGMMVEVSDDNGVHRGLRVTVHGFNQKGILVGNLYEFLPYDRVRVAKQRDGRIVKTPKYFMRLRFEKTRMFFFRIVLSITTTLIKYCESKMHRY